MFIPRNAGFSILAAIATLLMFGPIAAEAQEFNVDRPGSDYRNFNLGSADYRLCGQACGNERRCRAWTYVMPGVQGAAARCWLKTEVPPARSSSCCVSGIKSVAAEGTWRFVGVDYKNGPLNCNVPVELLDWTEAPSGGVAGQPYVGAVKYQKGDRKAEDVSLHAWTNPALMPNGTWVIYLTSWALRGNPGPMGIVARVQNNGEKNPFAGPTIASSRLIGKSGDTTRQLQAAVTLDPKSGLRSRDAFQILFVASNGGLCMEGNLARFYFAR